jgi:hypothetical protein
MGARVLGRPIIALSPDQAFARQLSAALEATGRTVATHASLDELAVRATRAALLVLHLDGTVAAMAPEVLPRLPADIRVLALLPTTDLAAIVEIMDASSQVTGMMAAEDFDPGQLAALATSLVAGDGLGLERLIRPGTQVHACEVGDYQEKSACIARVSEFARSMGVRGKYRASIEQCLDEMLMNALYDAPVDERGRPLFSQVSAQTRTSVRLEQKAIVSYAHDADQFAIAVRDAFGTLERGTVLRYLHKCLHSEHQIDRKAGGAGLGLYLMTSSSTTVYFNVMPGVATEAVCTFDLQAPKLRLESFGFLTERGAPAERSDAGASMRSRRVLIAVLIGAILVTIALALVVAWSRIAGS